MIARTEFVCVTSAIAIALQGYAIQCSITINERTIRSPRPRIGQNYRDNDSHRAIFRVAGAVARERPKSGCMGRALRRVSGKWMDEAAGLQDSLYWTRHCPGGRIDQILFSVLGVNEHTWESQISPNIPGGDTLKDFVGGRFKFHTRIPRKRSAISLG